MWEQFIKRFGNNKRKRTKTVKLKNLLIFYKIINFKVKITTRNQAKYTKKLKLPMLVKKKNKDLFLFNFLCG